MILHTKIESLGIFVLLICVRYMFCFKISTPSILLAYNKRLPSTYTLEVTSNNESKCFSWHSQNPKIVEVVPIFLTRNCSKKAVVHSVANLLTRKVTTIFATLEGTKEQLSCDVITDTVKSIELSYLRDELILNGSPETLSVVAKDEFGHIFSSINGLQVQWEVRHFSDDQETADEKIIRLSKFCTSNYIDSDINEWERRGLLGESVLAEPSQVGTAYVSATVLLTSKPTLKTEEILLKVLPDLKISPEGAINVLRYASVNIRVEKIYKGILEELNLQDFIVDVENPKIVSLTEDYKQFTCEEDGSSIISFNHVNKSYPKEYLKVNVLKPSRINFRLSRGDYTTLEEMKVYELNLDFSDEDNNRIYPSDNLRFSISFPTKLFHVIFVAANGTYAVIQATAPGSGQIRAEFKGVELTDGSIYKEDSISNSIDIKVYQKLSIFPPNTLLPATQDDDNVHEVQLIAAGGSGDYIWALSNYSMAKLIIDGNKNSVAKLLIYREGELTVIVTDRNNFNFITTAKVSVQQPLDIETYPTVVEAEVGNVIIVPTALLGYEDEEKKITRKFDDCSKVEPYVEIIEKHVLTYEKDSKVPAFGKGCMSLQFHCKGPGYSRVNIGYTIKTGKISENNTTYKTTTVLSCYLTLMSVHPVRVAVVALGTSKEIAFSGGPKRWPLFKEGHYTELEPSDPDIVTISLIKDPVRYNKELTVFRVTCTTLGETTLLFKIGNRPSATLQHPAKSETSIKFFCSEPDSVHLQLYKKKQSKRLTEKNIVKVPFYGEKIFHVDIWVKDAMGRKFGNISSLRVAWHVSDTSLAHPESYFDFMTHENAVLGYRKLSRNFMEFKMTGATGDLRVKAKVTFYDKTVLSKEGIENYKDFKEISTAIDLKLVSLRDINLYEEENVCENDACDS